MKNNKQTFPGTEQTGEWGLAGTFGVQQVIVSRR